MFQKRPKQKARLRLPHVHRFRFWADHGFPDGSYASLYRCRCGDVREAL